MPIGVNGVRGRLPSGGRRGGGGVPTVPLFWLRFWCENSKMSAKFKKLAKKIKKKGARIQKSQKIVRHYVAKTFFFGEGRFYLVLVRSDSEGGRR